MSLSSATRWKALCCRQKPRPPPKPIVRTRTVGEQISGFVCKDLIDLKLFANDYEQMGARASMVTVRRCLVWLVALWASASAQEFKTWKHGVIEPKGDAGFMLMVGQRDFGAKHKLKVEIVPLKNGATAHKALLAGELDSIESSPGATILQAPMVPISRFSGVTGPACHMV